MKVELVVQALTLASDKSMLGYWDNFQSKSTVCPSKPDIVHQFQLPSKFNLSQLHPPITDQPGQEPHILSTPATQTWTLNTVSPILCQLSQLGWNLKGNKEQRLHTMSNRRLRFIHFPLSDWIIRNHIIKGSQVYI